MTTEEWLHDHQRVIDTIGEKLKDRKACGEIVDGYAQIMSALWYFISRLIGDAGATAVVSRSVQLSTKDAPLLGELTITSSGVDFAKLEEMAIQSNCDPGEFLNMLLILTASILETLSELTGEALSDLFLRHLERQQ